jgi:hypothetical protein
MATSSQAPASAADARLTGSTNDLAMDEPTSAFNRILKWIPRILASKPHILALMGLGIYLIVLPLFGVVVSAQAELIGGNYTNVTSDIGACIAAGGTLHLVNQSRKRRRMDEERLTLLRETHQLLHLVYGDVARQLGHVADVSAPGTRRRHSPDDANRPADLGEPGEHDQPEPGGFA